MRVLVACEYSGRVRDAFIARGHEAISVDLLDSEAGHPHLIGDALDAIELVKPDLLIAHPPCTYLTNSGVRWLYAKDEQDQERAAQRWKDLDDAREFFLKLWTAPVPKICIENPIPHKHAKLPGYSQIIQPWQYGHGETKATCLWLKGLPQLEPTNVVSGREQRLHRLPPSPDRWKERSRTFPGIAAAMADQWGALEAVGV